MMKFSLILLLVGASVAVEYSALKDVIARAPVRSLRLSEIEAKIEAQGPMDLVGALCFQELQEIMGELGALTATHTAYQAQCAQTRTQLTGTIQNKKSEMDRELAEAIKDESSAINSKLGLTEDERQREKKRKEIAAQYALIDKHNKIRNDTKNIYDQDMVDFNKALLDLDKIKNVLVNSQSFNADTGAAATGYAVEAQGTGATSSSFLEAVNKVESDYFRGMTNRLTRASSLLSEKGSATEAGGIDKLMKLIYQIRNELWAEMDELTKAEKISIAEHKRWLLNMYVKIYRNKHARNVIYRRMGNKLTNFANYKIKEANHYIKYAKARKIKNRNEIDLHFALQECNAEQPLYAKAKANKEDEIETIEQMIKILRDLNWSGAVYNAISRIGSGNVDENPEPGFKLALQMNLQTGLTTGRYSFTEAKIPNFGRLAVKLIIGDTYGWASFDKWSGMKKVSELGLPTVNNAKVQQRKVKNLNVRALKRTIRQGDNAEGNLEIWADDYSKENFLKIQHASDGFFDFGDKRRGNKKKGSFQVHDFLNKQTILAVNNWCAGNKKHDIGLGNQPQNKKGTLQPDWTGANNFQELKQQNQLMTLSWYFQPADWKKSIKQTGQGKTTTKSPTASPTAAGR